MVAALLVLVSFGLVVLLVLGIMLLVLLKLLVLLEVVGTRADKSADRFERKNKANRSCCFLDHLRRHAKGIFGSHLV